MYDLAIVGGGPAGLATAIYGECSGFDCAVFERRQPPVVKPCGEGIMPCGVSCLEEMNVDIPEQARPLEGIRYRDGNLTLEGTFFEGRGAGVRRTDLHRNLVSQARSVGANLSWSTRVVGLVEGGIRTEEGVVEAHWTVGADGLHSRVREWAGLNTTHDRKERFGGVRHYDREPWTEKVEVYWHRDFELYVTPVTPTEMCVALLTEEPGPSFESHLDKVPVLRERLEESDIVRDNGGWGPLYQTARTPRKENVLLVGDAAGYRDAITGEGLSLAFEEARELVGAIKANQPDRYERRYRQITRVPFLLIESLLTLRNYPAFRRELIKLLGEKSSLFSGLITLNDRGMKGLMGALIDQQVMGWR